MGRDGQQTQVRVAVRMSGWWMDGTLNATYSWLHFCFPSLVADSARGPVMVSSSAAKGDEY